MMKRTSVAFFLVASLIAVSQAAVYGQGPSQNWQISVAMQSGNRVIGPNPPYFALHPPVYYSRIVPRAFGMSPFAAPAGVMPIENTVPVAPKAVSNPYFKNEDSALQEVKRAKPLAGHQQASVKQPGPSRAKYIKNPFYLEKVVSKS